jgi:hypothetical protein
MHPLSADFRSELIGDLVEMSPYVFPLIAAYLGRGADRVKVFVGYTPRRREFGGADDHLERTSRGEALTVRPSGTQPRPLVLDSRPNLVVKPGAAWPGRNAEADGPNAAAWRLKIV